MSQYQLFNQNIRFPDSAERFYDMQYRAWNAMSAASDEFDEWYTQCGDILTVLNGYEKKASCLIIGNSNAPLFSELASYEIYDISEDTYDDECLCVSEAFEALELVAEKYNQIIADQAAEEEYRAERKANRGRVVGGGFGVGGALKGMATAGAMNLVSGAGHGLVNAIGNAGSALAASSSKKALYNNSATRQILRDAIQSDILSCFNAHIHLLNERLGSHIISAFDTDKAGALFENAKKVPDKQKTLLIESFKNCPWDDNVLKFIFLNYKSERRNIWSIAQRFHVDLQKTAEAAFAASYTETAKTSEEEAQRVRKDILEQMQELGIASSDTVDKIERAGVERLLQNYYVNSQISQQMIFDSVDTYDASAENKAAVIREYGVWEMARKYNVQFTVSEYEKILGVIYNADAKKSEEKAQKAKTKIKAVMKELGIQQSEVFDKLESDCLARLCVDWNSADEKTCNDMRDRILAYDALERNKSFYLQKIQGRIETIWSAEDGEIFDNVYMNTDLLNQEKIKESIDFIKQKARTSSSDKYITALSNCTAQNIKKAKDFQKPSAKWLVYMGIVWILLGVIILLLDLGFIGVIASVAVIGIGISMMVSYSSMKKMYLLLTIDGAVKHKMICNE